jgi:hypothetical protein
VKLSHAILAVMLDGEPRTTEEIVARIRHFVPPEKAVRRRAETVNGNRANGRAHSKTGKVFPTRLPDAEPEGLDPDDAVRFVVRSTLLEMKRARYGYAFLEWSGGDVWQLTSGGKEAVRTHPLTAGGIAQVVRLNLLLRGEFP